MSMVINPFRFAAAGGGFAPTDIAGLAAWYDASDGATITASGGAVSQWNDKSVSGYNLTVFGTGSPTTGTRTINGLNTIDFSGTHLLAVASGTRITDGTNGTLTAFAVFEADVLGNSIIGQDNSVGSRMPQVMVTGTTMTTLRVQDSGGNTDVVIDAAPGTMSIATPYLGTVQHRANGVLEAWLNGATDGPTSDGNGSANRDVTSSLGIGGRRPDTPSSLHDGKIAEVVCYGAVLDATDRASVETYLATKWGITL